jgi:hypothetical protein
VLRLAQEDERVVSGAEVGSLAVDGGGDRFSDLDLSFAVAGHVAVGDVLDDWTRALAEDRRALRLVDLVSGPTLYRVFLLPDALQFDLSLTPAAEYLPRGPRFRLLFGETAGELQTPSAPRPADLFGWGAIYALHARSCIGRGRAWQAEHYVGAVRDHALALACLREGLPAVQARGYDDLSGDALARFDGSHIGALEPSALRTALVVAVRALTYEAAAARLPHADAVAERLSELAIQDSS